MIITYDNLHQKEGNCETEHADQATFFPGISSSPTTLTSTHLDLFSVIKSVLLTIKNNNCLSIIHSLAVHLFYITTH